MWCLGPSCPVGEIPDHEAAQGRAGPLPRLPVPIDPIDQPRQRLLFLPGDALQHRPELRLEPQTAALTVKAKGTLLIGHQRCPPCCQ